MSVIILTTGQPGAGKSYSRVRWLVTEFLVSGDGLYITNLPLNVDLIAEFVSKRTGQCFDAVKNRLVVIPDSELKCWRDMSLMDKNELKKVKDDDGFLPAEYFADFDLQGAHIAIDEFHRYCSSRDPLAIRRLWNDWLAEVRKLGCTFEAITQDISQVPRDFFGKVGQKIDLAPFGNTRDPFFRIKMFDWYQLKAGFTGLMIQAVEEVESIKDTSSGATVKWKPIKSRRYRIEPEYFKFYNSFQKSDNSEQKQDFSCPGLVLGRRVIWWFVRRNCASLFWRTVFMCFLFYVLFLGGLLKGLNFLMGSMQAVATSNSQVAAEGQGEPLIVQRKQSFHPAPDTSFVLDTPVFREPDFIYLDDFRPALFFENKIYTRKGIEIYANYEFNFGEYQGKVVTDVDTKNRYYTIDSKYIMSVY